MSNIAVQGGATGTGTVTLLAPVTNTNRTLTLPDATGTVLSTATAGVPVNGPAFSAYSNLQQSVTSSTFTKVQCNVEEFDTNSNYDNATNYRFTPTVAGYYQINGEVSGAGATFTRLIIMLYKNGVLYKSGYDVGGNPNKGNVSSIVYFNGSSDYVELYVYMVGTTLAVQGTGSDPSASFFNGAMVRSAV